MEKMFSVRAAADLLSVHKETILRWIAAGKIKAVKPGRDWRIPESALRAVVEGKRGRG
jgi:putative resolvase